MQELDFEIDIGRLLTGHSSLTVKVRVEGGHAQVMVFVAPVGRGNGAMIFLGAAEYKAFREMIEKTDAILGGSATNGRPMLLKK